MENFRALEIMEKCVTRDLEHSTSETRLAMDSDHQLCVDEKQFPLLEPTRSDQQAPNVQLGCSCRPSVDRYRDVSSSLEENEEIRLWTAVEQEWDERRRLSSTIKMMGIAVGIVATGYYLAAVLIWVFD